MFKNYICESAINLETITGRQQGKVGFESRFGQMLNSFGSVLFFFLATLCSMWDFSPAGSPLHPPAPVGIEPAGLAAKHGVSTPGPGKSLSSFEVDFFHL